MVGKWPPVPSLPPTLKVGGDLNFQGEEVHSKETLNPKHHPCFTFTLTLIQVCERERDIHM
jgi:hypothetical protein